MSECVCEWVCEWVCECVCGECVSGECGCVREKEREGEIGRMKECAYLPFVFSVLLAALQNRKIILHQIHFCRQTDRQTNRQTDKQTRDLFK